jgi:hypothetical protein
MQKVKIPHLPTLSTDVGFLRHWCFGVQGCPDLCFCCRLCSVLVNSSGTLDWLGEGRVWNGIGTVIRDMHLLTGLHWTLMSWRFQGMLKRLSWSGGALS